MAASKKKPLVNLAIYMRSGTVIRLPMYDYTITYKGENITKFSYDHGDSPKAILQHLDVTQIEAIVEERL